MDEDMFESTPAPVFPNEPSSSSDGYDPNRKLLDLVFVQDCTGSQGSYIVSTLFFTLRPSVTT